MTAQVDISNTILETERLILRPWRQEDLQDFYEYASVEGVGKMAGWPRHDSIETSRQILNLFISEKKTFALVEKATGKVIGSLGLEEGKRQEVQEQFESLNGREIGYAMSKDYWGRGLMPEAVKRVIHYAFEELGWDYLLCCHFLDNHRSRRVIEKCGFQYLCNIKCQTEEGNSLESRLYVRKAYAGLGG